MPKNFFGNYLFKDTLVHKADPRIKLIFVIAASIFIFTLDSFYSLGAASAVILALIILSKMKLRNIFESLRPFLVLFALIIAMYYFFSREKLVEGILVIWRFFLMVLLSAILTFTTSISQLIFAIEKFSAPIKIVGRSPKDLALMVSSAIRFIPLLFFESEIVRDAQRSRGSNLRKFKHISLFVKALLRRIFEKASRIADAIEARGYKG